MKFSLFLFFVCFSLLSRSAALFAEDEDFFLREIKITGNRITKESYIRSLVALREGTQYGLEELLRGINTSKENLEKTGLFSSVFVNDQTDADNRLTLTVKVSERGYFHLGPSGFVRYQGREILVRSGVSVSYDNLFGNGTKLGLDFPAYEIAGFGLLARSRPKPLEYGLTARYSYSFAEEQSWYFLAPSATLTVGKVLSIGLETKVNWDDFASLVFTPSIEYGTRERPAEKVKRWRHAGLSPYVGVNFRDGTGSTGAEPEGAALWGLGAEVSFYRDLLLRIVFAAALELNVQGGTVPEHLRLVSPVRGNRFRTLEGDVVISSANELRVPLPWNTDVVLVPFLDAALIGKRSLTPYAGGGIGLRWYKGFFDPLLVDLAFGRGITVNFEKRL